MATDIRLDRFPIETRSCDSRIAPSDWKMSRRCLSVANASSETGPERPTSSTAKTVATFWMPEIGRSVAISPRTNPCTDAVLPVPSAMVSTSVSVHTGVRIRLRAE